MNHLLIFVWTVRDIIGLCFFGLIVLVALVGFVDNFIDKHFRKKKKYYHKP